MTFVGFLDTLRVPNSTAYRSSLFSMCIVALESTTKTLSSGFMDDGAGRHHTSEGGKNVALFSSRSPLNVYNMFAKSQASLRAHRSFAKVSSWNPRSLKQRNCAHEDEWVESLRVMVFFHVSFAACRSSGVQVRESERRGRRREEGGVNNIRFRAPFCKAFFSRCITIAH